MPAASRVVYQGRAERILVARRLAMCAAVALLLAHLHLSGRPSTLCLLRAATGVPCPFCGGTTAAARVGGGDLIGAARSSPLAVAGGPVAALWPMLRRRAALVPPVIRLVALAAVLVASEAWQLHRYAWL